MFRIACATFRKPGKPVLKQWTHLKFTMMDIKPDQ